MQPTGEKQESRLPLPPFTEDGGDRSSEGKDGPGSLEHRDPEEVALAYTEDSKWRNRDEFFRGCEEIIAFLRRTWERELDYSSS